MSKKSPGRKTKKKPTKPARVKEPRRKATKPRVRGEKVKIPVLTNAKGRVVCGARANKTGKCDVCGHRPEPDERGYYTPHRGKCPVLGCTGKMRCQSDKIMANGRCRFHGGRTPAGMLSANWKSGSSGNSYLKYMPKDLARVVTATMTDADKLSAEGEVELLGGMLKTLLQQMAGASTWEVISDATSRMRKALDSDSKKKDDIIERCLLEIETATKEGKNDVELREEIRKTAEDRSRIAAREAKRQLDLKYYLSAEEGAAMMSALAKSTALELDSLADRFMPEAMQLEKLKKKLTAKDAWELLKKEAQKIKTNVARTLYEMMTKGRQKQLTEVPNDAE